MAWCDLDESRHPGPLPGGARRAGRARPRTAAVVGAAVAALAVLGCADRARESPTPQYYEWPERLNYRFEQVTELQHQARAVQRHETFKVLRLILREEQYVLVFDSLLKTSLVAGQPERPAPYLPEDTLAFYVPLGRRGELGRVVAGCDPAVPSCAAALPSAVAMELRRMIPGLPMWPVPPGGVWVDTLRFDDGSRPGGSRGSLITTYGPVRDTVIAQVGYWVLPWRSVKVAFHRLPGGAGFGQERPLEDAGITLIDRRRLLPVVATWAGAVPAPDALRALGIDASASRARVYLAGTRFDSLFNAAQRAAPGQGAR